MCHRGTSSLTKNVWGPPRRWGLSLGIIAGERIPCETSPVKIPQRHFAGEDQMDAVVKEMWLKVISNKFCIGDDASFGCWVWSVVRL
ncbi:hypothetical protein Tco_0180984 [Tanacetum coccineum]